MMNWAFNMSVRRASLFGVSILMMALVTLSWTSVNSYRDYAAKSEQVTGFRLLGDLIGGVIDLSLERSLTQLAIYLDEPVSAQLRQQIDAQRSKSDAKFNNLATKAQSYNASAHMQQFRDEFATLREKLAGFRSAANTQMALPASQRDKAFVEAWPTSVPVLIRDLEGLRFLLNKPDAHLTFLARAMLDSERAVWRIREQGGRERTWFAIGAFNRKPLAAAQISFMKTMAAEVDAANNGLKQTLAAVDSPSDVAALFNQLQQVYFGSYATLRESMYQAAATGNYPVQGPELMERSEAALKTAENFVVAATDAAINLMAEEVVETEWQLFLQLTVAVVLTIGIIWLAFFLRVRLAGRLRAMTVITRALADGDLDQNLEQFSSGDEVGQVAQAIAVLRDAARERVRLEAASNAADRERQRRAAQARIAERFAGEVHAALASVTEAVSRMRATAAELSSGATRAADQASSVSSAADQASANVRTAADAADQLASSIQEITRQIGRSAAVTSQAVGEASTATSAVTELADSTSRIDDVVRLISDIAGRTNLLALNATIEAARAGEAGKGFAVVASEVKSLATQTAQATSNIATQISAMQSVAERAVSAIRRIDDTIGTMSEISTTISSSIEEQGAATAKIARSVQEAAAGTSSMSQSLVSVKNTITGSSDASGQVLKAAEDVTASSEMIQSHVDRYFEDMKAA
jgi:methyl-accepting chemotaxis protein